MSTRNTTEPKEKKSEIKSYPIALPNYTQVPNQFTDIFMSELSGSAVKVYLAVCRKTIGWHKATDYISISQLMRLTGLSNRVVIKAIGELESAGLIQKERSKSMNCYTLLLAANDETSLSEEATEKQSDEKSQGRVTKSHNHNDEKSHTKETHPKEIQLKEKHHIAERLKAEFGLDQNKTVNALIEAFTQEYDDAPPELLISVIREEISHYEDTYNIVVNNPAGFITSRYKDDPRELLANSELLQQPEKEFHLEPERPEEPEPTPEQIEQCFAKLKAVAGVA